MAAPAHTCHWQWRELLWKRGEIFLLKMQTAPGLKKKKLKANTLVEERLHVVTAELLKPPKIGASFQAYTGESPG